MEKIYIEQKTFDKIDFKDRFLKNTIIEKVDFQTSFNYSFDPEINRIKKSRFSLSGSERTFKQI